MLTDEQIFGFSGWQLSIGLAVALATIIVFMTLNQRVKHSVSPLSTVKTVAWLLLPIYLLIFGFILYSLFQIAAHFPAPGNYGTNTAYGTALRWHVLALVGLITALGGLISAPLALIRVFTTERVTVATEEGLVTDRINAAVAGLGAEKTVKSGDKEETKPNIEVRIGAILSLERLAQKNLDEHVMIMQILCAYIRQNAPASGASVFELPQFAPLPDDPTTEQRAAAEAHQLKMWKSWQHGEISTLAKKLPPPRADIAIAMNVIGRRNPAQLRIEARWGPNAAPNAEWVFATPAPEWPKSKGKPPSKASIDAYKNQLQAWERTLSAYAGYRPDLRETNLQNTDLSKHILCGIRFDEAQIQGANLSEAQMQGANLWQAQMQGADLGLAQMQGADLGLAQMQGADLRQAQMQGADLWLAQMQGAHLGLAQMQGANLWLAQMQGANLRLAQMQGANLSEAQMQGANLSEAQMQGAHLGEAQLDQNTSLKAATLQGAALRELNYTDITQIAEHLPTMFGDASVIRPIVNNTCAPKPAHWPDHELDDDDFNTEWEKWQADPDNYTPPPKPAA